MKLLKRFIRETIQDLQKHNSFELPDDIENIVEFIHKQMNGIELKPEKVAEKIISVLAEDPVFYTAIYQYPESTKERILNILKRGL